MSDAKLTTEQWDGLGRFERQLSERIDVKWTLRIAHSEYPTPFIEVVLLVPVDRPFQSLDRLVEDAFENADVPGYECSGFGHGCQEPGDTTVSRNIDFSRA